MKKRKDAPHRLRRGERVRFGEIPQSNVVFKLEPGGIWDRPELFIKTGYLNQALVVRAELTWTSTGVCRSFVPDDTQAEIVAIIEDNMNPR